MQDQNHFMLNLIVRNSGKFFTKVSLNMSCMCG